MRIIKYLVILAAVAPAWAAFDYYSYWAPPMAGASASVAVADDAASVPLNPAGLAAGHGFNGYLSSYVQDDGPRNFHGYLDTVMGGFGYDWMKSRTAELRASKFTWTLGAPVTRWFGVGAGLNRLAASKPYLTSAWTVDAGVLVRPVRYVSFGAAAKNLNEPRFLRLARRRTYVAGVGIRPGWERLTLSCDAGWRERDDPGEIGLRFGADVEFPDGFKLSLGADDGGDYNAGIGFGFGFGSVGYTARLDEDFNYVADNAVVSFNAERAPSAFIPRRNFAEIEISGGLAESRPGFSLLGGGGVSGRDIVRRLEAARADPAIKGVILRVGNVDAGFGPGLNALADEIRAEVKKTRAAGKPVYAYIENVNRPAGYYIASAADVVAMPDMGIWGGVGTYMTMWRYTELMGRYGVEWDYITAGKYKGAFHQIGEEPTAEMEEEVRALVEGAYGRFLAGVAADRGLAVERLRELCEGPPLTAAGARAAGLVDENADYEGFKEFIARAHEMEDVAAAGVSLREAWRRRWGTPKKVRVIIAEGAIVRGESSRSILTGSRAIGDETVVRQLRAAREDDDVGAIVLRIDSGGGDGVASDNIYNEMVRCRESGKPVVASMGNLAASGGYFIALGAGRIYAEPNTITGSIGVVFAKPALEALYAKYGITRVPVKSHEHADALTYHRHFTDEEKEWVAAMADNMYRYFEDVVTRERGIEPGALEEMAQGRVYLGERAKELGLVDELGGLADALSYARAEAGLEEDAAVEYIGGEAGWFGRFAGAAMSLAGTADNY